MIADAVIASRIVLCPYVVRSAGSAIKVRRITGTAVRMGGSQNWVSAWNSWGRSRQWFELSFFTISFGVRVLNQPSTPRGAHSRARATEACRIRVTVSLRLIPRK